MRFLPTAVLLVAACAAAAGCATVAAAPPHRTAPRAADAGRPDRPDDLRVAQSPGREVLGTARPDGRPAPGPSPATRRPAARVYLPPPRPHGRPAVRRRRPHPAVLAHPLPGAGSLCGLGQRYGGWAADSPAARICRRAYGR